MKNTQVLVKAKAVVYNDLYLRLAAAIIAAHLIVSYGERESFFELLALPGYYPAMGASLAIAIIIVEAIYRITCYFDKHLPWEKSIIHRAYAQLAGGIVIPLAADCLLAAVYFRAYGTDIITAGYFKYNFVVIVLLVTLFNAYYIIHYMVKVKLRRKPRRIKQQEDLPEDNHKEFPILILIQDDVCMSLSKEDVISYHTKTLEQFYKELPQNRYFMVNRAHIVERSAIIKMTPGKSRTIKLRIDSGIFPEVQVSQRNAAAFKEWIETNSH